MYTFSWYNVSSWDAENIVKDYVIIMVLYLIGYDVGSRFLQNILKDVESTNVPYMWTHMQTGLGLINSPKNAQYTQFHHNQGINWKNESKNEASFLCLPCNIKQESRWQGYLSTYYCKPLWEHF